MAVGWEASFDGPTLLAEADDAGHYNIDVLRQIALVNDHHALLGMTSMLHDWIVAELRRTGFPDSWLRSATVHVEYRRVPAKEWMRRRPGNWTTVETVADLKAVAEVDTEDGKATSEFSNEQSLVGKV